MSFQIGDKVRSTAHAETGVVIDRLTWNEIVLVAFEGPGLPIWIDVRLLEHVGAVRVSLDEPTNYDERRAWWRELMPMWSGVPRKLGCTPEILVSTYFWWDCPLSLIDAFTLTVEHNDDGWRQCDLSREVWLDQQNVWQFEFNGHDNHDFQLDDFEAFWLHRWPTVHAVVAQCEVTL